MANTKSSKARIKTNIRDHNKNIPVKSAIKTLVKKAETAIAAGSDDLQSLINKTAKTIDTAVSRGILHKNTAARKKSRLMKKTVKKL